MKRKWFRGTLAVLAMLALLVPLAPAAQAADLAVERAVYNFLTQELGLNSAAACGVLANIEAESNFSLRASGDGGSSYGLCQWHAGRFQNLQSFCRMQGYDYWSLEGQLQYLAYELRGGYWNTYAALRGVENSSQGAYDAAYAWCVRFERPAAMEEAGARRGRTAQFKYWLRYGEAAGEFGPLETPAEPAAPDLWSDTMFYWQDDEPEETQAPAAATPGPGVEPEPQRNAPKEPAAAEPRTRSALPRLQFRYTPMHQPPAQTGVSWGQALPVSGLFLSAGDPRRRRLTLPLPAQEEAVPA